jgi:hypothetical protein
MRASDRRKVITSMMARVGARRSPLAQDDQAASRRCSGANMGSGAGLNVWTPLSQQWAASSQLFAKILSIEA